MSRVLAFVGAGLLALGSFLPWSVTKAPGIATVTKNGLEGHGIWTLVAAVVVLALLVRAAASGRRAEPLPAFVVALLAGVVCSYDIIDRIQKSHDLRVVAGASTRVGIGLWVSAAGTLVLIVTFFAQATAPIRTGGAAGAVAVPPAAPPSPPSPPLPVGPLPPPSGGSVAMPPQWMSDPMGRHGLRWWDGRRWTDHVEDSGAPGIDPYEDRPAGPAPR